MSDELADPHHQTRIECTKILYSNGVSVTVVSLITAVITTALLWKFTSHSGLLLWLLLIFIASGFRLMLVLTFNRNIPPEEKIKNWDRAYFISAIVAGISWGLLSLVEVQTEIPIFQLVPFLIVAFVLMGALPSYSASIRAYAAFLISIVVVTLWGHFLTKSQYHFIVDIIFIVYSPLLYSTAKNFNGNLIETLSLKHKQSELLQLIQLSHTQLSATNTELLQKQQILDREALFAQYVFNQLTDNVDNNISQINFWTESLVSLSGDLIQAARSPDGKHYLFLGDFTGHGLPAALGAVPAASIFTAMANKGKAIEKIAAELCNKLFKLLPVDYFCCAALLEIDPRTFTTRVLNAGLPPVFCIDAKGKVTETIQSTDIPLGIKPCKAEKFNIITVQSTKDDCFYIYSDGITEANNPAGEMWGNLGLQNAVSRPLNKTSRLNEIKTLLADYRSDTELTDDISILEYHVQ